MHSRGVCMRYAGVLINCISSDENFHVGRLLLLVEVVARIIKNGIRAELRELVKSLRLPMEAPYRKAIIDHLNLVFGCQEQTIQHWDTHIKLAMSKWFSFAAPYTERSYPL